MAHLPSIAIKIIAHLVKLNVALKTTYATRMVLIYLFIFKETYLKVMHKQWYQLNNKERYR